MYSSWSLSGAQGVFAFDSFAVSTWGIWAFVHPLHGILRLGFVGEECLDFHRKDAVLHTLPETNSKFAPANRPGPKKETSIPTIHFRVRTVSFREGSSK